MKKTLILYSLSCFFLVASCDKEETNPIDTASMSISFKATYGGEPLVLNQKTYDYRGKPVRFSKIQFYISDLAALTEDGATEIAEIQFVDLNKTHNTEAEAKVGTVLNYSKIPVGNYTGLEFGVGVAADLNRTTPSDYSTSHPLGADNSAEYWDAWDSYIFAKIEGQYDLDGDGFDGEDIAFAYHTGTDQVYTKIELDNFKTLKAGETSNVDFELDVRQLLTLPSGELLTLEQHDPNNQRGEMLIIMRNFKKALLLE